MIAGVPSITGVPVHRRAARLRALAAGLLAGLFTVMALLLAAMPAGAAEEGAVTLVTADGARHAFSVEIAETPEQRARGLMYRERLAADHGMLFDFGSDQPVSFWMKNTPLSLDMIFVRGDGQVAEIAAGTTPFSLAPVDSDEPVRFVLEVVAGTSARLGLKPGDRLEHPRVGAP